MSTTEVITETYPQETYSMEVRSNSKFDMSLNDSKVLKQRLLNNAYTTTEFKNYQSIESLGSIDYESIMVDPFIKFFKDIFDYCDIKAISKSKAEIDNLFNKVINIYSIRITESYKNGNVEELKSLANIMLKNDLEPFLQNIDVIVRDCVVDHEEFDQIMNDFETHLKLNFYVEFGLKGHENSKIDYSQDSLSQISKIWICRKKEMDYMYNYYVGKKSAKSTGKKCLITWRENLSETGMRIGYNYDNEDHRYYLKDSGGKYSLNKNLLTNGEKKTMSSTTTTGYWTSSEGSNIIRRESGYDEESQVNRTPNNRSEDKSLCEKMADFFFFPFSCCQKDSAT